MKKISAVLLLSFSVLVSWNASGQNIPEPSLLATMGCKLNDGISIPEVVSWGRARDDAQGVQQIHLRAPVTRFAGFEAVYDFQFAFYFQDYNGYANFLSFISQNNDGSLQELVTCGGFLLSDSVQVNTESEPYMGQQTLMDTQYCMLKEDATPQDAQRWLSNIAEEARNYGNNIGMAMNVRTHGNLNQRNEANRYYSVQRVGATFADMAERLDLNRVGELQRSVLDSGMENPNAWCNNRNLWNTFALYRAN